MAFDRAAAKAAGYSDQEINQYLQQQNTGASSPQPSQSNGIMGLLNHIGANFVPHVVGAAQMIPNELQYGLQKLQGNPNALKNYQQAYNANPNTNKSLGQAALAHNYGDVAGGLGQDAAGEASWMMPISRAGVVARGGLGAIQGTLQGLSQQGANAASVGTNAAASAGLNAISPLLNKAVQGGWGRLAFGPGGSKFGDIVNEVGPVVGGAGSLPEKLYNKMQPVRDQFDQLLADSKNGIPKNAIFGSKTVSGQVDPANPGLLDGIIQNTGISARQKAIDYATTLQNHLEDLHTQYLQKLGYHPDQILGLTQDSNAPTPLPVIQRFLHDLGGDRQIFDKANPTGDMARTLYGKLRGMVADASGNPDQYNYLQGLKQGGAQINDSLINGDQSNPLMKFLGRRIQRLAINGGLLGGTGSALIFGHPWAALPGLAAEAGAQPVVASAGLSFMNTPIGKMLMGAGKKATTGAIGNTATTPQN